MNVLGGVVAGLQIVVVIGPIQALNPDDVRLKEKTAGKFLRGWFNTTSWVGKWLDSIRRGQKKNLKS